MGTLRKNAGKSSGTNEFWTRRDFLAKGLQMGAGVAAGWSLPGCAQLDRAIVGDGANENKRVLILGGGLSGLVAARELHRGGVPFRIFEGSRRIGGRALTLDQFNSADQSAELGAEWFSDNDDFLLGLCRELKVEIEAVPWALREPRFFGEVTNNWQKLIPEIRNLDRRMLDFRNKKSDSLLDQMATQELITTFSPGLPEEIRKLVSSMAMLEWGESAERISALCYLDRMRESPSGWQRLQKRKWRIIGGMGVLTTAILDKFAGVLPERVLVRDHKLVEVRSNQNQLALIFQTPQGNFKINADVVICTLPWSVLRDIKGIDQLGMSEDKLLAIQNMSYGRHSKFVASYASRFWSTNEAAWLTSSGNWVWDSTPPQFAAVPPRHGILSVQLAGQSGATMGPEDLNSLKVTAAGSNLKSSQEPEAWQMMNWTLNPWSRGSVSYFAPGQMQKFTGTLTMSERRGRFIFAGEHTSYASMGTLNGAVESGTRAALEASRFKSELMKIEF